MSINFFNSEKILRLTPLAQDTEAVAESMLAGDVRVFPKLPNVQVRSLSQLWEMKFDSAPSTYALYVYALYPVSYILNAYEATGSSCYLDNAVALAMSFLDWELRSEKNIGKKREKILFSDHAVSNRTQALCYLACCLNGEGKSINRDINSALLRSGEYLADSENYSHYNHGLMMDLALLGLINTFEGIALEYPARLKDILLTRLQHSITRDLNDDGVHVENSPGYHFWMLGFLDKIVQPLSSLDNTLHLTASNALEKAFEYASHITRPDGSVPAIGDTHAGVMFKPSKGLSSKVFPDSNQVIFRSSDDNIWAHFGCGYKTHVHKHSDNGSFNLYYKGQDIFTDPGFLNYENSGDSLEIKKPWVHNTVLPKGQDQIIQRISLSGSENFYLSNLSGSRICGYKKTEVLEMALAYISDYEGVDIERFLIWIKPNVFLIHDAANSSGKTLQQVFHIYPTLNAEIGNGSVRLTNSAGLQVCEITQHRFADQQRGIPRVSLEPCFYAAKFNGKANSQRAVFETSSLYFLTVIKLGEEPEFEIDPIDGLSIRYSFCNHHNKIDLAQLKAELQKNS